MRLSGLPILLAVWLLAGTAGPPDRAQERPVESGISEAVRVVLMEIPVVARDAGGSPVKDLGREDLMVRIGGKEIEVQHLDPVVPRDADPDLPEVKLYVKIGSEYETAATEAGRPQYYVFFIDLENNDLLARDVAREQIKTFIRDETSEYDRIGVVSFDGRLNLEQSFTTDREGLARAVDRAFARSGRPRDLLDRRIENLIAEAEDCEGVANADSLPGGGDVALAAPGTRVVEDECLIALANEYRMENRPRVESFLRALEGTVRLTAGVHDRVTVFAYTHGVSMDQTLELHEAMSATWGLQVSDIFARILPDLAGTRLLEELLALAATERVAFHFLDTARPPTEATVTRFRGIRQAWTRPLEVAFEAPQVQSGAFAEATGGSLWIETNVSDALRKAVEFEGGRYWLGVYLDPQTRKKPPKIKIRSKRPGVTVTYGRGRIEEQEEQEGVRATVITGEAVSIAESGRHVLPFKLGFPSRDLDYRPDDEEMRVNLTLHLVLHDAQGRYLASSYHVLEHAYSSTGGDASEEAVLVLRGGLEAPPGRYQLVALIQNTLTGKLGRVVQELHIVPGT